MSLTSIYPMKKKRKIALDKTPVRRTRRNRDADSPMATSMLGTPSPNNSSIDADKDIIWDNCSPTQHLPMRLRKKGLSDASDIAQFMKLVPAENVVNVEQDLPPLLGLWMERGHELLTEKSFNRQPKAKQRGRKTRSKVGNLKSDVFSSELCKLAKMMESRQDSPIATDKLRLRSSKPHEMPMSSRTSTPNQEKTTNIKCKRKSLNASNELWGQDEWFEDESFLRQATQIEHDVCSQIYNQEKSNANDTNTVSEGISTGREQPKAYSYLPSDKTPVTRKMKKGKSLCSNKFKLPATKNKFEGDKVNKTENKEVCIVPTVPLKPRQLHDTFQNAVRVKSEDIDVNPKNDPPATDDTDNEVWDDLDDNELADLGSVLDTASCTPLLNKFDCQRTSRVIPSRNCFRMTKSSAQVAGTLPGDSLSRQFTFQKIRSPVTRSMTRDQNHRTKGQESGESNDTINSQHCSQEQIEKKRLLAIQRRKERHQQVHNSVRNIGSSKQINQR